MKIVRTLSETLARRTTRRGFLSRGADAAFGALIGAAAGTAAGAGSAQATHRSTHCAFPGPPCPCSGCLSTGVCGKPCIIMTVYYASGCWVTTSQEKGAITCCDCDCNGLEGTNVCGCGSDYHNNPDNCP